jgi:AraC family transcriptional regulator, arabinose operon regulatory protein
VVDFENVQVFRSDPKMGGGGLSVVEFGKQKVSAQITNRKLKDTAVVFVERGSGTLTTEESGDMNVQGPSLFWLFPNQLHSYGPDPDTMWLERWALFGGPMIEEFRSTGLISPTHPLVQLDNVTEIAHTFSVLHSEMLRRDALGWAAAAASIHRLVVQSATQSRKANGIESAKQTSVIGQLIEKLAFEDLDISALSQKLEMSPATLRRKCIAAHGLAPKPYQLQLRIDRAKELLTMTTTSIEEVAAAVGYEDSFYFSRLFFSRERRSPSEFRKLHARR